MWLRTLMVALLCLAPAVGDEGHQHGVPGERVGTVNFPVSCGPVTQKAMNRGVALLHSFWFEKAHEAFASIVAADPDCAMAHWGVAMSLYHLLWGEPSASDLREGVAAVQKARAAKKLDSRERLYVQAIAAFYDASDKLDHHTRAVKYEKAMEALHSAYPDDSEAAIFYAIALDSTANPKDKSFAQQRKCGEILAPLFPRMPQHPGLAHYLIHCYDNPVLAAQGLGAARAYAKIAPSVPHALHMPSHIFTRLGLWDESIASNKASEQAGRKFEIESHMPGIWDQRAHALDYEHYALLQEGRTSEAGKILELFRSTGLANKNIQSASYGNANVAARHYVELGRWEEAANLAPQVTANKDADAIIYLARALGNARLARLEAARKDIATLESLGKELSSTPYWSGQVQIKRLEAAGWLAYAEHHPEEAIKLLEEAARQEDATDKNPVTPGSLIPAHELLGDLLLELEKPAEALQQFEISLRLAPNRFHGLSGAARSAQLSGHNDLARQYYSQLLKQAGGGESSPDLQRARKFLARNQGAQKVG